MAATTAPVLHPLAAPLQQSRQEACATPLTQAAKASLLLAFFVAGMSWLAPYLVSVLHLEVEEWVITRLYLYGCLPAVLLGLAEYTRHNGFARATSLLVTSFLLLLSLAWTDSTEIGRGLLKFAQFVITLPMAALVVRYRYTGRAAAAFITAAVLSLIIALADAPASASLRFGTLLDASGNWVSNPNSVSGLAAFAAVLLITPFFERRTRPMAAWTRIVSLVLLALCLYCVLLSASRTSFLALVGTVTWMAGVYFRRSPEALITGLLLASLVPLGLMTYDAALGDSQGAYHEQLSERLLEDNEGNVGTLGSRTLIWKFGWNTITAGDRWAFGLGVGGVDKALGNFYEFGLFAIGRDGIRRLHSHSTYMEWLLMLGFAGYLAPLWLAITAGLRAWRMDRMENTVRRSALVAFAFLYSFGGVINTDIFWIAFGTLLWAELSLFEPRSARTTA